MTGKYLLLALLATAAFAQDPVSITPYQLLDARSGQAVACSGCSIYTYAAGTNTPLATYTSSTLATPNTNPVLTNSAGYAVNGATITGIWVGTSCYKFVAKDSSAVTLFTQDNICDRGAVLKALLATSAGAGLIGYTYPNSGVSRTVQSKLQETLSVLDFGGSGNGTFDNQTAILAAINAAVTNTTIVFPGYTGAAYRSGGLGTLAKIVQFDGQGSYIKPDTTGIWLTTSFVSDVGYQFVFKNMIFQRYAAVTPTDIFKLVGQPNTTFENVNYYGAYASHALVWNHSSYGTKFRTANWRYNVVTAGGALFYASQAYDGTSSTFSFNISFDGVDMSNNTARCVALEGGAFAFTNGVIESCSLGGIEQVANVWRIDDLQLEHMHFEANQVFNMRFPGIGTNPNTSISSNLRISGTTFTVNPSNTVFELGEVSTVHYVGNNINDACITSAFTSRYTDISAFGNVTFGAPAGCSSALKYLIATAAAPYVSLAGTLKAGLLYQYPVTRTYAEAVFGTINPTASSKIVSFQDVSMAERGYVTTDGDYFGRDANSTRDVSVGRYLSMANTGTGNGWVWIAENYVTDTDLTLAQSGAPSTRLLRISGGANPGRVGIGMGAASLTSYLNVISLQNYANNAAALAGGLTVGAFYRNADVVQIVH